MIEFKTDKFNCMLGGAPVRYGADALQDHVGDLLVAVEADARQQQLLDHSTGAKLRGR